MPLMAQGNGWEVGDWLGRGGGAEEVERFFSFVVCLRSVAESENISRLPVHSLLFSLSLMGSVSL